ncbi:hypothetical protein SEUCBS140593_003130 [Sporothrix eucalyptigena]|uniref:Uncharacterized protein n=1 Tax=Sporothrix eucalyptigena TaxID=1812306 RepID=A0ABP0BDE3_9PEZI
MKFVFLSLLAASFAVAAPSSSSLAATKGPCDLSSEDTGCYLIMDDSGCFLNTTDTARVLGCADPDPATAIDIFCRCWGCNGQELVNFMPTLNCTSKTVIPKAPQAPANSTNTTSTNSTGTGHKITFHEPVPVVW